MAVGESTGEIAYIGLGSNLEGPRQQLRQALDSLAKTPHSKMLAVSSFYRTRPIGGPPGQPDYINGVCALQTRLEPLDLLAWLQRIELNQGRLRDERWGARTLDLDILLFGELELDHPRLQLPHPRMAEREFVLRPLAEIAGALEVPGKGRVSTLLEKCEPQGVQRL